MLLINQIIDEVRGVVRTCIPQKSARRNVSLSDLRFAQILRHGLFHKQKLNKIIYLLIVIGLNINLIGCDVLSLSNLWRGKSPIPIDSIVNKTENNTIYIAGEVIKVAPLLGNNAYQVQDNTGSIWVISTGNLPSVGQNIFIKSQVRTQRLSLINQELDELYLVELEQVENP